MGPSLLGELYDGVVGGLGVALTVEFGRDAAELSGNKVQRCFVRFVEKVATDSSSDVKVVLEGLLECHFGAFRCRCCHYGDE